ncbi:MAG: hypothetical protein FJW21_12585 [Acidimicrobiia bacterium]|nr:hypothetical protein [Acidimicrobiia bacterium]
MIRLVWVLPVVFATGCAARVFTPPSGPAVPFSDAARVWEQATTRCLGAQRYVAQLRVRGWVGTRDQRIAQTLNGAVTRTDDIYLELRMLGSTVFQMAGEAGQATFVLPRDTRVLRAPTRDIVEALTGLRWGSRESLDVLTGCVAVPAGVVSGTRTGPFLNVKLAESTTAWLRQRDAAWQVHAARIEDWLVEYRAYQGGWPSDVRVTSTGTTPLDLQFTVSQVRVNLDPIDLPPETFVVTVPDHYLPMTLEELRSIGPLKDGRMGR